MTNRLSAGDCRLGLSNFECISWFPPALATTLWRRSFLLISAALVWPGWSVLSSLPASSWIISCLGLIQQRSFQAERSGGLLGVSVCLQSVFLGSMHEHFYPEVMDAWSSLVGRFSGVSWILQLTDPGSDPRSSGSAAHCLVWVELLWLSARSSRRLSWFRLVIVGWCPWVLTGLMLTVSAFRIDSIKRVWWISSVAELAWRFKNAIESNHLQLCRTTISTASIHISNEPMLCVVSWPLSSLSSLTWFGIWCLADLFSESIYLHLICSKYFDCKCQKFFLLGMNSFSEFLPSVIVRVLPNSRMPVSAEAEKALPRFVESLKNDQNFQNELNQVADIESLRKLVRLFVFQKHS